MTDVQNFLTDFGRRLRASGVDPAFTAALVIGRAEVLAEKKVRLERLRSVLDGMRKHVAVLADECAELGAEIELEQEGA